MNPKSVTEILAGNRYPGRGILAGLSPDGAAVLAYFIMGRSKNSRNRVFVRAGDGIRTEAFDPSQMTDPSLIIYAPVRVAGGAHIVTNGDQTDTIFETLRKGGTFEEALRTRTFEPDAPNFTPRISALAEIEGGKLRYRFGILKSADAAGSACLRGFFEYDEPLPGVGHLIHTYEHDGDPLPSFAGEPVTAAVDGDPRRFARTIWNALDAENRISLFVRRIDLQTGAAASVIINRNGDSVLEY